jgi:5-methylcytosine-specific restriction endonuclease McrA
VRAGKTEAQGYAQTSDTVTIAETDFLRTHAQRSAIHGREAGRCFYCLRRLVPHQKCIDHVVPQAKLGTNSCRNLVSCCLDCNSLKAERHAEEFVRSLYRDRRLSADELTGRLRALDDLAAGKLIPPTPVQ